MSADICRSEIFSGRTKWPRPLKAVEVVTDGETCQLLVYDVRRQPPYYDMSDLTSQFAEEIGRLSRPLATAALAALLEREGIYVDKWRRVSHRLAQECSALMHPDIRPDIRSVFGYGDRLPDPIPAGRGIAALQTLSTYDGSVGSLSVRFLETMAMLKRRPDPEHDALAHPAHPGGSSHSGERVLRSFVGYFHFMFRQPGRDPHWGIVGKGNRSSESILIAGEEDFFCRIYDHEERVCIMEGLVTEVQLQFASPPTWIIEPSTPTWIITPSGFVLKP